MASGQGGRALTQRRAIGWRRSLQKAFPGAAEEDLLAVLPAKDGELSLGKVQVRAAAAMSWLAGPEIGGFPGRGPLSRPLPADPPGTSPRRQSSRTQIYLLDEQPIFVDVSGKGDFFPTVFALWRAPALLPAVTVKHPAVTTYVVGGADLMLPGVDAAAGVPPVERGAMVAILSPGNPAPLAVGEAAMAASDVAAAGGKGRFLRAMHHYRDCLWALPGRDIVPNEGYYTDGVGPIGGAQEVSSARQLGSARMARQYGTCMRHQLAWGGGGLHPKAAGGGHAAP